MAIIAHWDRFSAITGIDSNDLKIQIWGRTSRAAALLAAQNPVGLCQTAKVLGAPLGPQRRTSHQAEADLYTVAAARVTRLACIPKQSWRAKLAKMLITPAVTWSHLISGRLPTQQESLKFVRLLRKVFFARHSFQGRRCDVHLWMALRSGHSADIRFLAAHCSLGSLTRWCNRRAQAGQPVPWGVWVRGVGLIDIPGTDLGRGPSGPRLHQLQASWRQAQLGKWLQGPTRTDSRIARDCGTEIRPTTWEALHGVITKLTLTLRSASVGGPRTLAACQHPAAFCPCCGQNTYQTVEHGLWECPLFSQHRPFRSLSIPWKPASAGHATSLPTTPSATFCSSSSLAEFTRLSTSFSSSTRSGPCTSPTFLSRMKRWVARLLYSLDSLLDRRADCTASFSCPQ